MKKFLKIFLYFIISILLIASCFVGYLWINEYNPPKSENIKINGEASSQFYQKDKEYKVITWNVGFFGMDKDIDFFMDGGKMIFPIDKEHVNNNIKTIIENIKEENPDSLFLQEVDTYAKRTFYINQVDILDKELNGQSSFAYDIKVKYMPYPFPPLGQMESGIYSSSKIKVEKAERHQLPISFSFPVRLSNFKRGFIASYNKVQDSDKYVIMINSHLDAYDGEDSSGKIEQTKALLSFMNEEYSKGNYVILGADFNQALNNISKETLDSIPKDIWHATNFQKDLVDNNFSIVYGSEPTARIDNQPYAKNTSGTYTYTIDGFIVSKNIEVKEVSTIDKDYQNTDHNPVKLIFKLK